MLYNINDIPKNSLGQPIGSVIFDIKEKAGLSCIKDYILRKGYTNEENLHRYIQDSKDYYRMVLYDVSMRVIGRKINPHMFRHTKSIFLLNKGASLDVLKEFLGHSSLTSTEIYAHASSAKIEKELNQFDNYN
jgi:integrase/recombinase XerC